VRTRPRVTGWLLFALAPLFSVACASSGARLGQFDTFAEAGARFAAAVPAVLDASFEATVATSSLALEQAREGLLLLPDSVRQSVMLEQLRQNDDALVVRLTILRDLQRHARILHEYFVALQALAETDAESSNLSDVTGGLVTALGTVSPSLEGATIGGHSVSALLPPVVEFAVARFQLKALEDELRRNAGAIERELAVQEASLTALGEAMATDLEAVFSAEYREGIERPYLRSGALPRAWSDRRLASFRRQARLASVTAASQAAATLRAAFVRLVENRVDRATISALFVDINDMLTFLETATEN